MAPERRVANSAALADELAQRLAGQAERAGAAGRRCALALPGGSVAEAFFPALARAGVDWTRFEFFWCDERAVPPEHPDSNCALAARLWLDPAGVPPERRHRMPADVPDLDRAADDHAAELERVLGPARRLDVALLGVGPDGHVASLFPGHAALEEQGRAVLAVHDAPKPPPRRLTLALPVLAAAELVVVAALGPSKAEVVRAALEDAASPLPVARLARLAPRALFLLDPEAAARLG